MGKFISNMEVIDSSKEKQHKSSNTSQYVFLDADQLHRTFRYTCFYTSDGSRIKVNHSNRKKFIFFKYLAHRLTMNALDDFMSLRPTQFYCSVDSGTITFSMDRSHVLLNNVPTSAGTNTSSNAPPFFNIPKWAVSTNKGHLFSMVEDKSILAMTFSSNARKRAKSILDGGKPVCLYRYVTLEVILLV